MLGEVCFSVRKEVVRASLDESLTWRCDRREVEHLLNETCSGPEEMAKVCPTVARHLLYQAAQRLGGCVVTVSNRRCMEPVPAAAR